MSNAALLLANYLVSRHYIQLPEQSKVMEMEEHYSHLGYGKNKEGDKEIMITSMFNILGFK